MELFHYRSVKSAINEISTGKFKFSGVRELNDPIEGYCRIYWQGDEAAWEGLFRNYICGLFMSMSLYRLAGNEKEILKLAVPLDIHQWDNVPIGKLLMQVENCFLNDGYVRKLISNLVERDISCSPEFLTLLLRFVHERAFYICMKQMQDHNLIDKKEYFLVEPHSPDVNSLHMLAASLPLQKYENITQSGHFALRDMLDYFLLGVTDQNETAVEQRRLWVKLRLDFPTMYVEQSRRILFPNLYVVCFSSNAASSVMWGNYAQNQAGACLIYSTDESNCIPIKSGVTASKDGVKLHFRNMDIHKIDYSGAKVQRNFFTSLGRCNRSQIQNWLLDSNGNRSRLLDEYGTGVWRETYWSDFHKMYHAKMSGWDYEKEYRIGVSDTFYDYERKEEEQSIFLSYHPQCLKGVIWGVRTSLSDKRAILEALKALRKNIKELDIRQAEYNELTNEINIRKVNYIAFQGAN